jgi:hypothetical protein
LIGVGLLSASLARAEDGGTQPELSLPQVLERIGKRLAARASSCSFVEKTTVEELDANQKVTAREIDTYRVERTGKDVKRTRTAVERSLGDLNPQLRPKEDSQLTPEERERRRNFRTPFHLEEQAKFRFKWAKPAEGDRVFVAFEPLEPKFETSTGVATLDTRPDGVFTIESKPSKFPVYLSKMDSRMAYANTPCGLQLARLELTGEGGILFVRTRFHTLTVLDEHSVPPGQ